jgi:hypothetical protein
VFAQKGENLRDSINSRAAFETLHGPHGWLCLAAKYFEKAEVQISGCRKIAQSRRPDLHRAG